MFLKKRNNQNDVCLSNDYYSSDNYFLLRIYGQIGLTNKFLNANIEKVSVLVGKLLNKKI